MDYPIIAIVHIEFFERSFNQEDVREMESLLRSEQDIYHLVVHEKAVTFYMWGKEGINYGILDRIKEALKNKQYPHFVITADEYLKTEQKYCYDASQK